MSSCRFCGASIVFVPLSGRDTTMPLEPEPAPNGNVRWDRVAGNCVVLSGGPLELAREEGEPLYRSHFASCPGAAEARRA
jgi:hypothetical protein